MRPPIASHNMDVYMLQPTQQHVEQRALDAGAESHLAYAAIARASSAGADVSTLIDEFDRRLESLFQDQRLMDQGNLTAALVAASTAYEEFNTLKDRAVSLEVVANNARSPPVLATCSVVPAVAVSTGIVGHSPFCGGVVGGSASFSRQR